MKKLLLLVLFFNLSCQVYNTASRDKLAYGNAIDSNTNFGRAFLVFSSRCVSCHANFASWTAEQDWVTNGFVTAGSLANSKAYYRLYGSNMGIAAENMPLGSALTSQELADIRNWIVGM